MMAVTAGDKPTVQEGQLAQIDPKGLVRQSRLASQPPNWHVGQMPGRRGSVTTCHRVSPSQPSDASAPSVTVCHHLSPSVTCAREKPKACFIIITGPPTGLSPPQFPQVTDGDSR
jgi:hypothetical protein